VGWLVQIGRTLFGDGGFGVRLGALCCGAIGTVFTYRLTRHLFGEPSALVAAVLMQALPFFFMSGFLMTPDAPLTAAWAGALYCLERALIAERRAGWWGAGVCFGFGLLSKYTIALLGVSTLVFMLSDARARGWFKRFEPYGAVLVAAALFAPVIVWNAQHEWASFVFQTSRRLAERPEFALPKLVASALVLLTPVGVAGALWVLGRKGPGGAQEPSARGWRFLKYATWVPVAVFTLFSLRHEVKLDWTGAPWVALVPGLAFGIAQSSAAATGWMSRAWVPTVVVVMLLYALGLYDLAVGLPAVGYGKHAELVPVGWRQLGTQVAAVAQEQERRLGQEPLIVGLDRYALASELGFYQKSATTSGNLFGRMGLMYERWLPASEAQGRALLLVSWDPAELNAPEIVRSVERLDPIEQGELSRDGRSIRPYFYRLAYGYHGSVGER
jgi:dolichol-phosphate mannosyltransferase